MINSVNDTSALQLSGALNAFKNAIRPVMKEELQKMELQDENSVKQNKDNFSDIGLMKSEPRPQRQTQEYIKEVKNFAGQIGINNISDEEISYAMKYGRSLLADYIA
jgi:hypothetical protein